MQLARNIFPERISREKITRPQAQGSEGRARDRGEVHKDKILELYLNQIDLGNGAYGVETASQRYFGKSVRDLNLAEAATLAGAAQGAGALQSAPLSRARHSAPQHRHRADARAGRHQRRRREPRQGVPAAARAQESKRARSRRTSSSGCASSSTTQFGKQLYEQGLKVYTTLDVDMQSRPSARWRASCARSKPGRYGAYTHRTLRAVHARSRERRRGQPRRTRRISRARSSRMDPRTGAVRALDRRPRLRRLQVQSRHAGAAPARLDLQADRLRRRDPERPAAVVHRRRLAASQRAAGRRPTWTPQNYDRKFVGDDADAAQRSTSRATSSTIRLGMELGEQSVIDEARKFGITTPIPPYPSIHIGAADVYPIEMVSAYTAFATLGVRADAERDHARRERRRATMLWEPTPTRVAGAVARRSVAHGRA